MQGVADYWSGFATHDESAYPELWDRCFAAWAPGLGPSGLTLNDMSGDSNYGTLTGLPAVDAWQINGGRYAMTFAGASQYVNCGRVATIEGLTRFSASFWLRRTAAGDTVTISKRTNGTSLFYFGFSAGLLWLCPTATSFNYGTFTIDDTEQHHAVMLFDGSQATNATRLRLVLDGREQTLTYNGTVAAAMTTSTANLLLSLTNTTYSNGSIDDVRLYSRTLSINEAILLSQRRCIAYEARTRRRRAVISVGNRRRRMFIGAG